MKTYNIDLLKNNAESNKLYSNMFALRLGASYFSIVVLRLRDPLG